MKRSQSEFAVRAKAYQLQHFVIRPSVDQHQIGLEVTVPMVFQSPVSA